MSWNVQIPQFPQDKAAQEGFVNEVPAEDAIQAVHDAECVYELDEGPAKQLSAAKHCAVDLIEGALAGKRAYRVSLSGHADPGDQTTAPDMITVNVVEIR